jgi:hypothetical protein
MIGCINGTLDGKPVKHINELIKLYVNKGVNVNVQSVDGIV